MNDSIDDKIKVIMNGTEKTIRVYGGEYFEQDFLESGSHQSHQDTNTDCGGDDRNIRATE